MPLKEDKFDILTLSTMKHISASLNHLLQPQSLSGDNMWYCPQCSSNQNAATDSITKCGSVLILHLKRYDSFQGNVFKDTKFVECLPHPNHVLEIPIEQNDSVSFSNRYSLIATINHSGSLNAGHYWAFIKEKQFVASVYDSLVLKVKLSTLNNTSSYVLFCVRN